MEIWITVETPCDDSMAQVCIYGLKVTTTQCYQTFIKRWRLLPDGTRITTKEEIIEQHQDRYRADKAVHRFKQPFARPIFLE
ncbi:MAG: hypothetical protein RBT11_14125 [Desulfobacterales bacterium]|jgi:hypothetical protein|nr:hypothetical protein [Desulfobacterales bacterium]